MTPEELQQKIDFIIQSHANSAARTDSLEADRDQMLQEQKAFRESLNLQKERLDGLMLLAQQLLEIARTERETRKAEIEAERKARETELEAERKARETELEAERRAREAELEAERKAREAELEAERERQKGLEGRVDGIEEMTKFLRELLEGNLRPPDKPPETEN